MKQSDILKQEFNNKVTEAQRLYEAKDLEGANKIMNEADKIKEQMNLQMRLENAEKADFNNSFSNVTRTQTQAEPVNATDAFLKAIKAKAGKATITQADAEVLNATTMKEGVAEDGGVTVPADVKTAIKELRRSVDALENYVNIEKVSTLSGSRVIEKNADMTPFADVEEGAAFGDLDNPKFATVKYNVKKRGGTKGLSRELLADSAENIKAELVSWISKKSKVTRNSLIIKALDEKLTTAVAVKGTDELKDIFNVTLDPAFENSSVAIMNQDAFNALDKLKDSKGEYVLQSDVTQASKRLLFGLYPVIKVSNATLPTKNNKAPMYLGDLKEAITIFDRETISIEFNEYAGNYWTSDTVGMKARERFDVVMVDEKAVVKAEFDVKKA